MTASGAVPPSPLCSTRGARGLYVVLGVREDVLEDFGRRPSSPETNSMAGRVCVRKKIEGRVEVLRA